MREKIELVVKSLLEADAVVIAASNGLSISEGYHLFAENKAFVELLGDFRQKYGIRSLLQGMFYNYPTEEEKWTLWSRIIWKYTNQYEPSETMKALHSLVRDKPYFIVTTNGEGHFEKTGFAEEQIFEIEGSSLWMRCANNCTHALYPTENEVFKLHLIESQRKLQREDLPICPTCGGPMQINYAVDGGFCFDYSKHAAYNQFLQAYQHKKVVILELGIGYRNTLIKAPLMEFVSTAPQATYITINKGEVYIKESIKEQSIGFDGDITEIIPQVAQLYQLSK